MSDLVLINVLEIIFESLSLACVSHKYEIHGIAVLLLFRPLCEGYLRERQASSTMVLNVSLSCTSCSAIFRDEFHFLMISVAFSVRKKFAAARACDTIFDSTKRGQF